MHLDLALRSGVVSVPCAGLGPLRPGALRPVLLTRLGADETRGLLFRHLRVLLQPRPPLCRHHLLLLRHRFQALHHLQEVNEQLPGPQCH